MYQRSFAWLPVLKSLSYLNLGLWYNVGTHCFTFLSHRATPGNPTKWSPAFFTQGPLKNTKSHIFTLGSISGAHVELSFFLFSWCWQTFSGLLKPKSPTLLPCGKNFFIKTCIIIPLSPLLPISSQPSTLPLKINMCTQAQKLDAECNVEHALKESRNSVQTDFTLWVCNKKAESGINVSPRSLNIQI